MSTWPQWTIAALITFGFVNSLYKDGQKSDRGSLMSTLVAYPGHFAILYYGGFWSVWGLTP